MTVRQFDETTLVRVPLQPVPHLLLLPRALEDRTDLVFAEERDDLDAFSVAAVVAVTRVPLAELPREPRSGPRVHSPDAGDPGQQARRFVEHFGVAEHVSVWWDGAQWQGGRVLAEVG